MKITPRSLAGIMFALNWQGHIELPDSDIVWIATEISNAINGNRQGRCDNCGSQAPIIVTAAVGQICEDCITNIGKMADSTREEYESARHPKAPSNQNF